MHLQAVKPPSRLAAESPLIRLEAVSYRYPDGHLALDGIDLEIFPGDRIALVGQNGAGKTTLAKHVNGLLAPTEGRVYYQGLPLKADRLRAARLDIGLLFQDPDDQLFCNTVFEDVLFGPLNRGWPLHEASLRAKEALVQVGLESLAHAPPHHLSYGQRKRAALATLLAMDPKILILDEPTANLDPRQEEVFLDILQQYQGTLICISHDLLFLYRLCERAVVLAHGRIHHDYTLKELVSHRPSLREHGLDFTFRFFCCGHPSGATSNHHHAHTDQHHRHPVYEVNPADDLLILEDVSYRYPNGTQALDHVNLVVKKGERIAVVGENGAGKSTLAACLMGILQVEGEYRFKDRPITSHSALHLWRHVGLVFQDCADQLFCPSCYEEVAFGPRQLDLSKDEIDLRVQRALAAVHLDGFAERVPHNLSGGEKKRLAVASVLSLQPEVLILDEPTANLDPQGEELLMQILDDLDVTLICISHDLCFLSMICDRTIVMHTGRIIRDYTMEEFVRDDGLVWLTGLTYGYKNECCREIQALHH